MVKMSNPYMKAQHIWDELCKELGIDPDMCRKITIEITIGEPIQVFPEMLVRKDSKIFGAGDSDDDAR